jgi:hypothetical protein
VADLLRISADPNRPGWRRQQALLDQVVHDNLAELNAIQAAAGLPLLEDPMPGGGSSDA